jgi:hypothetical protein
MISPLSAFVPGHQLSQRLHGAWNFTRHIAVYSCQQLLFIHGLFTNALLGKLALVLSLARRSNPGYLLPMMELVDSS